MMAAKMFQRKLLSMYEETHGKTKEKPAFYKFIEEENQKWQKHFDAHIKSGKHVKASQVQ